MKRGITYIETTAAANALQWANKPARKIVSQSFKILCLDRRPHAHWGEGFLWNSLKKPGGIPMAIIEGVKFCKKFYAPGLLDHCQALAAAVVLRF
ncbi:hypothetical protein KAU11_01300 [Candidatus Babeliales bacterium]|nr:hypothetical protein [Candidatus Babeliales bacterium]